MKTMCSPRYRHNGFLQHDVRSCYTHLASVRFDHSAYCESLLTTSYLLLVLKKFFIRLSNESIKSEKVKKTIEGRAETRLNSFYFQTLQANFFLEKTSSWNIFYNVHYL